MQTHYWSTAILRIEPQSMIIAFSQHYFLWKKEICDPKYKKMYLHFPPKVSFFFYFRVCICIFHFNFIYFCKRREEICVLLNFKILYQIINETIKVLENNVKYSNWKYVRSFPCYKITFWKNKCLRCHLLNLFEN